MSNIILNGGFEIQGATQPKALYWNTFSGAYRDAGAARSGSWGLNLPSRNALAQSDNYPLVAGIVYNYSFYLKPHSGADFNVEVVLPHTTLYRGDWTNNNWQTFSGTTGVDPSSSKGIDFKCRAFTGGWYVDDVSLQIPVVLPPPEAKPTQARGYRATGRTDSMR